MLRCIGLLTASAVLLASTAANAQLVNGTGTATATVTSGLTTTTSNASGAAWSPSPLGNGGAYGADVTINPDSISFMSGAATATPVSPLVTPLSRVVSSSVVNITLTNNLGNAVMVNTVHSEIVPAGLGFYLQDRSSFPADLNPAQGYPQTLSDWALTDLKPTTAPGVPFASADFSFKILSGAKTLYTVSGILTASLIGGQVVVDASGLDGLSSKLEGFVPAWNTPSAQTYAWDATPVDLNLGWNLAPGESSSLTYLTEVSAFEQVPCIDANTCFVAFSAFGDPVGRGGGITSRVATFAETTNRILGINFDQIVTVPFSFDIVSLAVPEPSAWVSLITGFGLLGAVMRRRRGLTAA